MNQQVIDKLNELETTAEEVAQGLKQRGIKGKPGSSGSCPVAKYLIDRGFDCDVSYNYAGLEELGLDEQFIPLPDPIRDFILEFDNGVYPELEELL